MSDTSGLGEYLAGEARKENERRQQVRDVVASYANENLFEQGAHFVADRLREVGHGLFGSDDAPLPKATPPASRWVKPP